MGGEVAVSEPEPGGTAQCLQRLHGVPGFVPDTPAGLRIGQTGQRIHHGIKVGADAQAQMGEVIADIDKVAVPFHVNAAAQAAAIAAIDNIEEIEARCGVIVSERGRVEAQLSEMGWWMPAHQANFVYLSTGSDTMRLATELEKRGVVVRPFDGEGIRVTIGSPAENDRFLAAITELGVTK